MRAPPEQFLSIGCRWPARTISPLEGPSWAPDERRLTPSQSRRPGTSPRARPFSHDVTSEAFTLVRHAMPQQVPDEDPSTWRLGPEGVAAARQLSSVVPQDTYLVASPEPKACATALLVTGREPALDVRLVEVRRPSRWNSAHRSDARRYLSGESVIGWEDQDDVIGRISEIPGRPSGARRTTTAGRRRPRHQRNPVGCRSPRPRRGPLVEVPAVPGRLGDRPAHAARAPHRGRGLTPAHPATPSTARTAQRTAWRIGQDGRHDDDDRQP